MDMNWYDAWDLVGSPQKIKDFHESYPQQPGPPKYLAEWISAWHDEDDKPPMAHRDRNAPVGRTQAGRNTGSERPTTSLRTSF